VPKHVGVLIFYESYFSRLILLMDILMCGEIEKKYISAHNPNYFVKTSVVVAWNVAVLKSGSQSSLPCI
jgi:hypothetical protein